MFKSRLLAATAPSTRPLRFSAVSLAIGSARQGTKLLPELLPRHTECRGCNEPIPWFLADLREQRRTAADHSDDINPTLKGVRGGSPVFVFPSKSREFAAFVRCRSLVFAPTVAKTVAIDTPSVARQLVLSPIVIRPLYKDAPRESSDGTEQRHRVPTQLKHLAAEAGKDVAEALRDIVVMIAGEAAKRLIWG